MEKQISVCIGLFGVCLRFLLPSLKKMQALRELWFSHHNLPKRETDQKYEMMKRGHYADANKALRESAHPSRSHLCFYFGISRGVSQS